MSTKKKIGIAVGAWDIAWKLVALRRAFREKDYGWAFALIPISSGGILPIWYLLRRK